MIQRILGVCTGAGVGGGILCALWFPLVIVMGGFMEGNPIGGLLGGIVFFLPLGFFGLLFGLPIGFAVGAFVCCLKFLMRENFRLLERPILMTSSAFAALISFLAYYYWLMSQAPLIEMSQAPLIDF